MGLLRNLRFFFHNLWTYRSILWNDRDWDHAYLTRLILFKLQRMDHALEHGMAERTKPDWKSIQLCIKLLERLDESDYMSRPLRHHDAKWGKPIRTWLPIPHRLHLSKLQVDVPGATTPDLIAQEGEERRQAYKMGEVIEKRDRHNVFAIMAKYLPYWWD